MFSHVERQFISEMTDLMGLGTLSENNHAIKSLTSRYYVANNRRIFRYFYIPYIFLLFIKQMFDRFLILIKSYFDVKKKCDGINGITLSI